MRNYYIIILSLIFFCTCNWIQAQIPLTLPIFQFNHGAIVRGDTTKPEVALLFTGDEYFEGIDIIANTLKKEHIKGNFFLTGRLYQNPLAFRSIVKLKRHRNYMGPHSNQHLLYNDWVKRDSILVTKDSFYADLRSNYATMEALGIHERVLYLVPPFEWWNAEVVSWCNQLNINVINFSPGTITNADYTYPQLGSAYKSSAYLIESLFDFEAQRNLNGAMILIHIGTDPRRLDKLYLQLRNIIQRLKQKGYIFKRVDELLFF